MNRLAFAGLALVAILEGLALFALETRKPPVVICPAARVDASAIALPAGWFEGPLTVIQERPPAIPPRKPKN